MTRSIGAAALAAAALLALALPAAALAQRFHGTRYIHNPFHSDRMTVHRAHWAAVRVHSPHLGGCDF